MLRPSCDNQLAKRKQNTFWHDYNVIAAAGVSAGIGLNALPPVRSAIGNGFDAKDITLARGKLTTGITVKWSSILISAISNHLKLTQAAFRVSLLGLSEP